MMHSSSHDGYVADKVTLVQLHRTATHWLYLPEPEAWSCNPKNMQVY